MDAQTQGRRLQGLPGEPTRDQHQRAEARQRNEERDTRPEYVHPLDRHEAKLLRARREAAIAGAFRAI